MDDARFATLGGEETMIADRPFDLALLDTEGIRKRKRKRLLLWSLPCCIVLFVLTLWVGIVLGSSLLGKAAYERGNFTESARYYGQVRFLNVFEKYKMEYNYGTALLGDHKYTDAHTALAHALTLGVPKAEECQVRVNLVLAIAGEADVKVANKKYDEAILLYDQAKSVIDGRDCGLTSASSEHTSSETRQADEKLQEMRQQISDKQNSAKQQRNGDTPTAKTDATQNAEDASTPSDQQLKNLQERQNAVNKRSRENTEYSRDAQKTYSTRKYDTKTW
jgi:hypothetical protein